QSWSPGVIKGKKLGGSSTASSSFCLIAEHSFSTHEMISEAPDGVTNPERIARLFPSKSKRWLQYTLYDQKAKYGRLFTFNPSCIWCGMNPPSIVKRFISRLICAARASCPSSRK